jgi:hypothetical protein
MLEPRPEISMAVRVREVMEPIFDQAAGSRQQAAGSRQQADSSLESGVASTP